MLKLVMFMLMGTGSLWASDSSLPPVKTVDYVDIQRYSGKWFEIASIPQFFQRKCYSDTSAEYSLVEENQVKVYNTCTDKNGEAISATGRAKIVDTTTNSKLKVTFLKLWNWIYFVGGKYWILDLDADYRWVFVGDNNRKYGWILARETFLSDSDLKQIHDKIKVQGYDTCKLLMTRQKNGYQTKTPLCEMVSH